MTSLPLRSTASLLLLVALVACDQGGPGGSTDAQDGGDARAEYTRELFFIAADATGAAVLDFTAADVGSAVRRTARGWAEAGSGWTPLYDLAWEGTAVRRPWRLVPNGPLRLRVAYGGEMEALAVRDGDTDLAVLETADLVAEWAPFNTAQVILREATLALGGEPMRGWLIDARFGVSRQAADDTSSLAPNGTDAPATVAPAPEEAQLDSPAAPEAADSAILRAIAEPTPASSPAQTSETMPVRSVRGVLIGPDGETLVIAETDDGLGAWLWTDGEETTMRVVTLTRVEGEREGWTIEGGSALSGSLSVMDEEPLPVSPRIVRGSLRIDGATLEMHGVLRAHELND